MIVGCSNLLRYHNDVSRLLTENLAASTERGREKERNIDTLLYKGSKLFLKFRYIKSKDTFMSKMKLVIQILG